MTDTLIMNIIEPEVAPTVRRGPGRPKTPPEAKPQQKAAHNAYHNVYYHTHKAYVPCACGALIQKTKMTAHLKSKRHGIMVEYLATVAGGGPPPLFRSRTPPISL